MAYETIRRVVGGVQHARLRPDTPHGTETGLATPAWR